MYIASVLRVFLDHLLRTRDTLFRFQFRANPNIQMFQAPGNGEWLTIAKFIG
jgi:hypothetical protein